MPRYFFRRSPTARLTSLAATLFVLAAFAVAGSAQAHPGALFGFASATGFLPGFLHPLDGTDHVVAMLLAGVLAGQIGRSAVWLVPLAVLAMIALGGILGAAGGAQSVVEFGIFGSILVMGGLVAWAPRLPSVLAAAIAGGFAIFHGIAHGAAMPATSTGAIYGLGFLAASAALIVAGLGAAYVLRHGALQYLVRFAAAVGVGVAGMSLLAA